MGSEGKGKALNAKDAKEKREGRGVERGQGISTVSLGDSSALTKAATGRQLGAAGCDD